MLVRRSDARKPLRQLARCQPFDRELMFCRGNEGSGDGLACRETTEDQAVFVVERLSGPLLQVGPQRVSPLQQRDVIGMFPRSEPDDAGLAMRTATVMHEGELFETHHATTATGEVLTGSTPHPPDTQHNHIVGSRHHQASGAMYQSACCNLAGDSTTAAVKRVPVGYDPAGRRLCWQSTD